MNGTIKLQMALWDSHIQRPESNPEGTWKRCNAWTSVLNKRTFQIADRQVGNNCNNTSGVASGSLPPTQREALLCLVASRPNPSNGGSTVCND